jgi:hypothetical protein
VSVAISGIPSSYQPGTTYPLTVSVSGSPGAGGGFDLSVTRGTLSTSDSNARIDNGEATNSNSVGRSWVVNWLAPSAGSGTAAFHVAGLAADGDGSSAGDAWNLNSYWSDESGGGGGPTGPGTTGTDWFLIAFAAVVILAVVMVLVLALRGRSQAKKEQKGRRRKRAQKK